MLGELAGQPERLLADIPAVVAQMRKAMDSGKHRVRHTH
jgi:hypothetical protein